MNPRSPSTHEQAVLELARARPLLRARDLAQQELPTIVLSRLVAAGKLERIARGVYGLPGLAISEHRSLAEVALRVPQGVVCLLSALRVHGIGTHQDRAEQGLFRFHAVRRDLQVAGFEIW